MGGNQLSLALDPAVTTIHALHAHAAAILATQAPRYQDALGKLPKGQAITASLTAIAMLWLANKSVQSARAVRKLRAQGVPEQKLPHLQWWLLGLHRYLLGHILEPEPDMATAHRSEQQLPLLHGKDVDGWDRSDQAPRIYVARTCFGAPSLVVADPKTLPAIMSAHSYSFIKPDTSIVLIGMVTGDLGMVTINGDVHKRHRRIFFALLDTAPASTPLPLHDLSSQLTLNVIGRTGMNYEFNALALDGTPITRAYHDMLDSVQVTPWFLLCLMYPKTLGRIPTAARRRFLKGHRVMTSAIKDMLARIHELIRQNADDARSEHELVCEIQTFLGAGQETTSSTLAMAMLLLARFPDVQDELVKEVAVVDLDDYDTLSQLPRLNSVINETLWLFPPANLTFREAGVDITVPTTALGPLALQKGLEIEIPIEWNPRRWDTIDLVQGGNVANRIVNGRRQIGPYDYLPFLYKLATDLHVGGEELHVAITMRPTNAWVRVERRV
ncbi:hypothetical protein AMAG_07171 [Allomyces macrogynus ATCC 38327]|uniref:Cytochrome P450 n=1 Tax=Allomyces macrogynus (strain ATCC 38327) TaxID=578462 RepID=A0A0L0SHH2_ALLM3|nr:hypothetical protein AMAG_07171 [Allomyces macrogynus ATCC 38327]|eukprot:KNE61902.1 hypothetical protein AMAG_07171 [Allomyces macrogynus ATCC 38327]